MNGMNALFLNLLTSDGTQRADWSKHKKECTNVNTKNKENERTKPTWVPVWMGGWRL
jgi:hypothetical protein